MPSGRQLRRKFRKRQSGKKRDLDKNMISIEKILCLLHIVVAVASDDQFDQCALVNELVEQGEVRDSALLLFNHHQACKLKFRLRDFTSCLCSAAAPAICFKDRMAGVDAIPLPAFSNPNIYNLPARTAVTGFLRPRWRHLVLFRASSSSD